MALQKLTTRRPDESMLEVSIKSFKTVLYMDGLSSENPDAMYEFAEEHTEISDEH